jgi:hypothetical protein
MTDKQPTTPNEPPPDESQGDELGRKIANNPRFKLVRSTGRAFIIPIVEPEGSQGK